MEACKRFSKIIKQSPYQTGVECPLIDSFFPFLEFLSTFSASLNYIEVGWDFMPQVENRVLLHTLGQS